MLIAPPSWFPSVAFAWVFTLSFLLWVAAEIIHHLIGHGARILEVSRSKDGGSYWLLMGVAFFAFMGAYLNRGLGWGIVSGFWQYVGLALLIGGVVFREWAILVLGRHFSVVVAIEEAHHLVTRPPYHWFRHPAYTGAFVAMIGFHLALGGWGSLLFMLIALLPAFLYRIRVEERALLSMFGPEYQAYMSRTWRLFPGW